MLANPRAFVFDLDGTLVDGYAGIATALASAMRQLGVEPWSEDLVRCHVGRGLEALVRDAVGEERTPDGIRLFREEYERVFLRQTLVLPGVAETLDLLERAGIRLGLATNKPEDFARRLLDHLGLSRWIRVCRGPAAGVPPKPDPTMVHLVLDELGVAAGDAIYVGDMPIDVATARAAGTKAWLVPTGSSPRRDLEVAGADRVLDRFAELACH